MKHPIGIAAVLSVVLSASHSHAQQYFQSLGGTVTFTKASFADTTNPANWDILSPTVAITRDNTRGIYNPLQEPEYSGLSPAGTMWFFGGTVQQVINGTLTLSQFDYWFFAHNDNPPSTVGVNAVVYLMAEDAFVDIRFTQWGVGTGGGGRFSYVRAIVPAPSSAALGFGCVAFAARRRRVG